MLSAGSVSGSRVPGDSAQDDGLGDV